MKSPISDKDIPTDADMAEFLQGFARKKPKELDDMRRIRELNAKMQQKK